MAEIKLTKEQQKVVDTRNCNLLVAAAAGSGKTAVLVKRIIKKVTEEKQDIDRLLIVTFTNAAAAEMRERISTAIENALEQNPDNTHLQRQLLLLHNAQITTIHSFCLSVIREFFHLLELDPGFRIGDEAELSLLKADVLEEVLEGCYEEKEEAFLSFVESFSSAKNKDVLTGYIKNLYDIALSQPWPQQWLDTLTEGFSLSEDEFGKHPMLQQIMKVAKSSIMDCLALTERMIALTEEADGPFLYRDTFLNDQEGLLALKAATKDYLTFAKALSDWKPERLSSKKQNVSEEKKELAKNLRDHIKKQIKKLKEDFFYESPQELWSSMVHMKLPMQGLVCVTKEFMSCYEQEKREKNLLDFNDLEHMALRILVEHTEDGSTQPTAAARTLSARYDEIMIDEYQDSNLIQELVLNSVSGVYQGQPNIFMVGDVKQSIYRFRMACPDLFMEKYETYQDSGARQKIDLAKNFRSRNCILDAINVLFAGLMHKDSTEVEYDAAASLYFGASYPEEKKEHTTEVLFVSMKEEEHINAEAEQDQKEEVENVLETEDGELSQEEKTKVQTEALAVSQRIKELMHSNLTIGSEERAADYGDIVILLRTMSGWSETFLEVFAEQGIPAYADTSSGYFKTFEIRKTLEFLRILDNPKQDIAFAAVLHSPIGNFNAQELAELKVHYGTISTEQKTNRCLYEAAKAAAQVYREFCEAYQQTGRQPEEQNLPEHGAVCEKAARFFDLYERLSEEAEYVSIHELMERFYRYSGFYDAVTVMPGGERRRGNLDMLVARAKQYEATSFSGLYDFIRYIDRLMKYEVDFGEANNGETGRMVRIMSIHKSKGLEFPVVFLCGMEKKFNRRDIKKRLIVHSKLGLGPEYVDTDLRVKSATLPKKVIAAQMNEEMIAEELRVLYVAMTRAREKLILVGTLKDPEKRYAAWKERSETINECGMLASYVLKADSYFDFLCPFFFSGSYTTQQWQKDPEEGLAAEVSIQKSFTDPRFPEASFEGHFVLREYGKTEQRYQTTELQKTKEELKFLLEQIKTMEPEETKEGKEIRELLELQEKYQYPYETEANFPVKVTVSELKRLQMEAEELEELTYAKKEETQQEKEAVGAVQGMLPEEISFEELENYPELIMTETPSGELLLVEEECSYPEFLLPEKTMSGADRGTIYHHIMEQLPFQKRLSRKKICELLDAMVEEGKLRTEERELVNDYKIWKFFTSSLGKRMCQAESVGKLHREQPFVLGLSAKELYPDTNSEEMILVQGIIDAFFEEEDGLVLMDYKTDYIKQDAKEELTKKYQGQLGYYRKALERLKGKQVKEIWFYSFSKDLDFQIE